MEQETDLSLEDMMDQYYDKMEDREKELKEYYRHAPLAMSRDALNVEGNNKEAIKENDSQKGKSLVIDVEQDVPSNQNQDANSTNMPPEVESIKNEIEEAWRAERVTTEWGTSDDVVTIGNGRSYYYFKIPHKVCESHLP